MGVCSLTAISDPTGRSVTSGVLVRFDGGSARMLTKASGPFASDDATRKPPRNTPPTAALALPSGRRNRAGAAHLPATRRNARSPRYIAGHPKSIQPAAQLAHPPIKVSQGHLARLRPPGQPRLISDCGGTQRLNEAGDTAIGRRFVPGIAIKQSLEARPLAVKPGSYRRFFSLCRRRVGVC
jgi:hypothetical protein